MVTSKEVGFNNTDKNIFSQLLWANTLRGDDSTGVFGVTKYGNLEYIKNKGHAGDLQTTKEYKDFEDEIYSSYHMVVGHNRKATRGFVNDENAHPFIESTVALVHNGTLTNYAGLTNEIVTVDSHAILHSIVERGYEQTLKEIEGAFTLAWYDTKDKTLRVIRNKERPLYIASTVGSWFFASEQGMLEWILGREQVTIEEMEECTPGTMYSFKLEDKKNMWFQTMDLYEPPKSTPIVYLSKKTEQETEKTTTTTGKTCTSSDFKIGTKILIQGENIQQLKAPNESGYDHLFFGKWFFDESIQIKCWATTTDIDILEATIDDTLTSETILFQAEIMCVMTKKDKITLICKNIVPYVPCMDGSNNEVYEDEYMLTNQQCSHCCRKMNFEEASLGIIKYSSATDFEVICQHCVTESRHLVH